MDHISFYSIYYPDGYFYLVDTKNKTREKRKLCSELSKSEILDYLCELGLTKEQFEELYDYSIVDLCKLLEIRLRKNHLMFYKY